MAIHKRFEYAPDHAVRPGLTLRETLDRVGMTQKELADRTGLTAVTISRIIAGEEAITPETAQKLESVLGVRASFWINLQCNYQADLARIERRRNLESFANWPREKEIPTREMIERGCIAEPVDKIDLVMKVLDFLGFATPEAWETSWRRLALQFRKSARHDPKAGPLTVWLRQGEIEARKINSNSFDKDRFREALRTIRGLTRQPFEKARPETQRLCANAGVAAVIVPEYSGTRVCGATRWLTPQKALIQLSIRYRTDDQFWFTFFHEAGHILMHQKKAVFLDLEGDDEGEEYEMQANRFASDFLIPPREFQVFIKDRKFFSREAVENFAAQIGIAPGIVVGRLQHEGLIPHKNLNALKRRLGWDEKLTS